MKTRQVKKGSLNLKVKIIDWTPINKAISEHVGEEVECRLGKGFIEDVEAIFDKEYGEKEIKSLIVDNECCARVTESNNFYISDVNNKKPFSLTFFDEVDFYKVSKINENGGRSIAMFPSFAFTIDIDDIKKCLTGEEKSLFELMKGRYGYNPRIVNNEMGILELVYHNDSEAGDITWMNEETVEVED